MARLITGSGAICSVRCVQNWKILLPVNTMPPCCGDAAVLLEPDSWARPTLGKPAVKVRVVSATASAARGPCFMGRRFMDNTVARSPALGIEIMKRTRAEHEDPHWHLHRGCPRRLRR